MYVSFDLLPDHARIWIYQADRKISSSESDIISRELTSFTEQWQVHGNPMRASFKLFFNQFVVLAADEGYNAASGCSIDDSVRALKNIGAQCGLDFFNRASVAFKINQNIEQILSSSLKQKYKDGLWNEKSLVFNNAITRKEELEDGWILPASKTWLNRYLTSETVTVKE